MASTISMGTEIDGVNEFEEILCLDPTLSIRRAQDLETVEAPAKLKDALAEKR